jgi:hypothetical protein
VSTATGRREGAYQRLAHVVERERKDRNLLPLDEATRRLRPFSRTYVGLRPIPVNQIIGTDGRGADFDRDFHPRRPDVVRRRESVERAFRDGAFPPIVVYQLGDAYFVIDGHHRVASARRQGIEMIDAEVTELRARWHLDADADVVELIHAEQERLFMTESGLADARPEARIRFSRPAGYLELLENVQIHGYHAMRKAGRVLEPAEIAADWYEHIYGPAVEATRRDGLEGAFPDATEADLFLAIYQRRRELFPDCGCPPLEETAPELLNASAPAPRRRRLLRELVAGRPSPRG